MTFRTVKFWTSQFSFPSAILKIDISPYLGEKSSDFHEILYTAAIFLNWVNVTWSKMQKLHWTDTEFDRSYFFIYVEISVISAWFCEHARQPNILVVLLWCYSLCSKIYLQSYKTVCNYFDSIWAPLTTTLKVYCSAKFLWFIFHKLDT